MNEINLPYEKQDKPVVLVTGGAGYVGSHACKALAFAGYLPVAFDNLEHGYQELVRWGPLIKGDLRDEKSIARAIDQCRPQAVMHFAALTCVGESVERPDEYFENNVRGSANLLAAVAGMNVPNLIFSSSCAVYGAPTQVPIPESHGLSPISPYGANKLEVEQMIESAVAHEKFQAVSLRYFNAAGADPAGETGECHDPETHLIPLALMAAAGTISELKQFGEDYPTPDGTCIRDYIHVSDLAKAHVLALTYLQSGGISTAFNLANGNGFSVREIVDAAERVTGRKVPVRVVARRSGDPAILVGNASRAQEALGWTPLFTSIDQIIEHAWAYMHSQALKSPGQKA